MLTSSALTLGTHRPLLIHSRRSRQWGSTRPFSSLSRTKVSASKHFSAWPGSVSITCNTGHQSVTLQSIGES